MNFIKISKKSDISGYRILIIAIALSLAWHVFWLSAVKIVSGPMSGSPVKFSKIAFLGPILTGAGMEVRASPASRGLLEKRYRDIAEKAFYAEDMLITTQGSGYADRKGPGQEDRELLSSIDEAVGSKKLEPDYIAE